MSNGVSGKSDLVEVDAELCFDTEEALLLDVGDKKVWVPKSLVEDNDDGTFSMPAWLALEKELI